MPHAPKRRRLPVVFFELDVVLAQIDADRAQRFEVKFLHVLGRRLQDHLQLQVLEQAVGILTVAAIGGTPRGLHVRDLVWIRAEDAEECFRRHGAGADFNVVGLLDDGPALGVRKPAA